MKIREDGKFALGLIMGSVFTLLAFLATEKYSQIILNDPTLFGAVLGALIAGFIGVTGQVLVIYQTAQRVEAEEQKKERAVLQSLLVRMNRTMSTFAQCKSHLESTSPFDNIKFDDREWLMKPLKINDLPSGFSDVDLSLPLSFGDFKLFNLMNVFDSVVRNFGWVYNEYDREVSLMLNLIRSGNDMKFSDGKMSGNAELDIRHYHEVRDFQNHYRQDVYSGLVIGRKIHIALSRYLSENHEVNVTLSELISESEWQELTEAVELGNFADDVLNDSNDNSAK
ncbi:hypothetical protein [Pseudosulfitobacter koreensis]|uniref:Phage abortive infection protein n=1 Tax=Pseudosulfitobacter koreensis TaxID=2968472 RepID=A0ABT1Z4E3_9RHOB|nr:hypothetical protein [Pseudosulfitobacter koreense]MCR8827983.1 hypothetical protein [Pseudosulfitobacter koreense]